MLTVTLLGSVGAQKGSAVLDVGPPKQCAVFAVLAARPGQIVPQSEMIWSVWGSDAPQGAVNSLYAYVARLRKALSCAPGTAGALVTESNGYRLDLDSSQVDMHLFRSGIERARQLQRTGERAGALSEVERALTLWRGTPMNGLSGPFAELERARLEQIWLGAVELRCSERMALGQHAEVASELTELAARFPLRETLTCMLMRCYIQLGQRERALATYHVLRASLSDELGIAPGRAAQDLLSLVLRVDRPATGPPTP